MLAKSLQVLVPPCTLSGGVRAGVVSGGQKSAQKQLWSCATQSWSPTVCSLQPSLPGAPAPSLSDSEESVFSGLEDSGSDSSEEEDGASGEEQHSRMEKATGQQVGERAVFWCARPRSPGGWPGECLPARGLCFLFPLVPGGGVSEP